MMLTCVRWDLDLPFRARHVAPFRRERGWPTQPSCVFGGVPAYAPELDQRCRAYLRPTNQPYRVDETYLKSCGPYKDGYRAVASTGQTIDLLLTAYRDAAAAKGFFRKAFQAPGHPSPRGSKVDTSAA